MTRTLLLAISWAVAMIGVAAAGRSDLIPAGNADTLVLVMPALAVASIGAVSARSCRGVRA